MTKERIEKMKSSELWEFAHCIEALAEKCEMQEKELEALRKIRGKKNKVVVMRGTESTEFKNLAAAAEYIGIYTWEAEDMLRSGETYNEYCIDEVV